MGENKLKYIFILCSERSGSNLLNNLLGKQAQICAPSPTHLIRYLWENKAKYGNLSLDSNWNTLIEDALALFESKLGDWRMQLSLKELKSNIPTRSLASLLKYVFSKESSLNQKKIISVKEIRVYPFFQFMKSEFNDPHFIYMVRDPRDMALSWKNTAGLRGCVIRAANVWKSDQRHYLKLLQNAEINQNIHFIKYESLLKYPLETQKNIFEFLNLPFQYDEDRPILKNTDDYAKRLPAEWENIGKPILTKNFNKYKTKLSSDEIKYIEAVCANEMEALGYSFDYSLQESPTVLEARIKHLEIYEKPAYQDVDEEIKMKLAKRRLVLANMANGSLE